MFEKVIRALVSLCLLVLLYVIVVYVLGVLGIHLPPHVLEIVMLIFVLLGILYVYRLFAGSGWSIFPD